MTEGEYFSDDEIEEGEQEESEEEDLKFEFKDINKIKLERNKLNHDRAEKVKDLRNRIGIINLDLFGDPRADTQDSKLMEFLDELNNPYLDGSGFQKHGKEIIRLVKQLQIEYNRLHKFYENFGAEVAALMDNSIKLYETDNTELMEELESYKGEDGTKKTNRESEHSAKEVAADFLKAEGKIYLERYKVLKDVGEDIQAMNRVKGSFVKTGTTYFSSVVKNPKEYLNKMWLSCIADIENTLTILNEKKDTIKPSEPDKPSTEGYNNKEKSKKVASEKEEEFPSNPIRD